MKLHFTALLFLKTAALLAQGAPPTRLPQSIGVLLYPGITNLDIAGPLAYFNSIPAQYNISVHFISDTLHNSSNPVISENVTSTNLRGERIVPTHTFLNAPKLDILLIPGGYGTRQSINNTAILNFVKSRYKELQYFFIVCTGGAFPAKVGLYDGRRVTTNKAVWNWVISLGPKAKWVPEARWVVDGNIWSSSGAEAGTDMANAFVSHVFGARIANEISRTIEYVPITNSSYDPFAAIWNVTGVANATYPPSPVHKPVPPPTNTSTNPLVWAVVTYPGMNFLDMIAVIEYVAFLPYRNFSIVAETLEPVGLSNRPDSAAPNGMRIVPSHTFKNPPPHIDVLVIPGRNTLKGNVSRGVIEYIEHSYPKAKHTISVGTGAYLLAQAGVLNGRRATTTKALFNETITRTSHANVTWTTGRWVRDGNVWTSSGTASGLDATYALAVELYGFDASQESWKMMEYIPRQNSTDDPFAIASRS